MHAPESVLENEMHKLLWDFEIQTYHLILARWLDLLMVKKKLPNSGLCRPGRPQTENQRMQKDWWIHRSCKRAKKKKQWNMEVMVIPIEVGALGSILTKLVNRREALEIRWQKRDHPDESIIKIGQNTEKGPGDLKRCAVTHTQVRNHQRKLL